MNVSAVPVPFDDWKVLITAIDITPRKQAEEALNRRLALESLLSFVSASFVNIQGDQAQFDDTLLRVISKLGAFFEADQVALVSYSAAEGVLTPLHQWCATGVSTSLELGRQVPIAGMPWLEKFLQTQRPVAVANMAQLPPAERAIAAELGLTSVLLVPLLRQQQINGWLSFAAVNHEQNWSEVEFGALETIGQIIAAALERRQITAAWRESELRFRQIAENINEVFYLADMQTRQLLYVNPAYEQIWGRKQEALYANMEDFLEAVHPDDRPLALESLRRQARGAATEVEYRLIRPDGEMRWVRDRAFPVPNAAGQSPRVSGLVADITVYKTMLANLERTNRRLEGLRAIDQAILQPDAGDETPAVLALRRLSALVPCPEAILYSFDFDQNQAVVLAHLIEGRVETQPGRVLSLESVELAELRAGRPLHLELTADNLTHPLYQRGYERGIRAVLKLPLLSHGTLLGKLTLLARQPGFFTPEDVDIAAEAAGQIAITLYQAGLNAQIQQHTASLERLVGERTAEIAQINRRLELATQAGDIGIWDWEIGPDRLVWNTQMYQLYGLSGSETNTRTKAFWLQQLHPEDVDRVLAHLDAALRNEHPYDLEFRIIRPDGAIRHIKSVAQVLFDAAGRPERMLGINMDITERHQAEKTLHRSRDQLSATNAELARLARLKDEFLANMSHELRTPLNAILGLAEILQEQIYGPLTGEQLNAVKVMGESGRHLLALISDILDVSKMEAGRLTLEVAPIYVEILCQGSLRLIKEAAQKKQLNISTAFDDAVKIIPGDERRLKQLLVNLLINAVKFTPPGGTVGLEVTGAPEQEVAHFTVWDNGIGIAAGDIERLFQPFIQVDSSLTREQTGTGLGLVLVQRIAKLHGGSVSLASQVGQGSRFTVSLPWPAHTARPVRVDSRSEEAGPPRVQRALVVEDHPLDAELLTGYLAEWGIEVAVMPQGELAVEQAARQQPDVILLDLHLPGLSGWAVLAQLKAEPRTEQIPVIITSVVDDAAQGLALGAAAYLVKPVARESVQAALNQAAGRAAPDAAAKQSSRAPLILLAEDNEQNIMTIRDFLQIQGFRLVVARNGNEAVLLAAEEQPDVILMDIQMPQLDGLEAIRRIRARIELSQVPIIALTALAMPGDRERCLAAGANDYLSKPISLKGLGKIITAHLNRQA